MSRNLVNRSFKPLLHTLAFLLWGCHERCVVNVREWGAIHDGSVPETQIVQRAIDDCSSKGGGTVVFPAGRYLVGTLQIKDNVTLQLDQHAVLLGALKTTDYRNVNQFEDGTGRTRGEALIIAVDAKNIGIDGLGLIDGQGRKLDDAQGVDIGKRVRPFLIRLIRCENASIRGVRLQNAGAWSVHLSQCRQVSVSGVTINSHGMPNNDGIDVDCCQRVEISRCAIDSGDDAVCLKSTRDEPCRGISVDGCVLKSDCSAVKLGTESMGDFENIKICHCQIRGAGLGGIKLFSVDGARMENVMISDISMNHVRVPVMIRLGARLRTFYKGERAKSVGAVQNISIDNLIATNASQLGVLISGIPQNAVENVSLRNIQIYLSGGEVKKDVSKALAENAAAYPEVSMFGVDMPAYGVFARHVKGLRVDRMTLVLDNADSRHAIICDDVIDQRFSAVTWQLECGPKERISR